MLMVTIGLLTWIVNKKVGIGLTGFALVFSYLSVSSRSLVLVAYT